MSALPAVLNDTAALAAATSLTYAATLLTVAITSVVSRSSERRRDARATLTILVRRRPPR